MFVSVARTFEKKISTKTQYTFLGQHITFIKKRLQGVKF